jgi:peptidoglycan/xylan/chitin deacetylase (PgdA/CDA1 family)
MPLAALRAGVKGVAIRAMGSDALLRRKLEYLRESGVLTVLNLHQVGPASGLAYPPLAPELFDYLLTYLRRHFELTTFREHHQLACRRPKLILSFDDAYRDFLDYAVPIMDKHGARANQNVIPACLESGRAPLNVLVFEFVSRAPASVLSRLDVPGFDLKAMAARPGALASEVAMHVKNRSMAEQDRLGEVLLPQLNRYPEFCGTAMMTVEEVRQIGERHEIGAHTYHHASMAYESNDYLRADVAACRAFFDGKLGFPLDIYALPNGSYRPEQLEILAGENIPYVLLVDENFSWPGSRFHRRITFDATSRDEVRFRATGAYRWPSKRAVH